MQYWKSSGWWAFDEPISNLCAVDAAERLLSTSRQCCWSLCSTFCRSKMWAARLTRPTTAWLPPLWKLQVLSLHKQVVMSWLRVLVHLQCCWLSCLYAYRGCQSRSLVSRRNRFTCMTLGSISRTEIGHVQLLSRRPAETRSTGSRRQTRRPSPLATRRLLSSLERHLA